MPETWMQLLPCVMHVPSHSHEPQNPTRSRRVPPGHDHDDNADDDDDHGDDDEANLLEELDHGFRVLSLSPDAIPQLTQT